ncbi:ATP-binding cassette domain-containing protein [Luethyella okanaganae]|uniref:ATP-binding cassette domain-containing protein n=1 Tax=Luethyella okanaganae TaxID=69372 RepID=A0ABW1VKE3_9MICO
MYFLDIGEQCQRDAQPLLETRNEAPLSLDHFTVRRQRRLILDGITLDFQFGVTAILGPNGAGKTTLLEAIVSLGRRCDGEVRFSGLQPTTIRSRRRVLERLGFMPQDWEFIPGYTVAETVEYAAWLKGAHSRRLSEMAQAALGNVNLAGESDRKVGRLSGGMRQRVGLAEALVCEPEILVLDEPTVGLDPEQRIEFRSALRARSDQSVILMSTHLTEDAGLLADRIIVLAKGRILFDGAPDELETLAYGDDAGHSSLLEQGYIKIMRASAPS